MSKIVKKTVFVLLTLVCAVSMLSACATELANRSIPLTDLAGAYTGQIKDESGNLLVPFDVAYPEAFESGQYPYDEEALLLKMEKGTNGLSRNLRKCGFSSLEKFSSAEDGDWFRADLEEGTDIHTAIQRARSLSEVMIADYDYIYQAEVVTETESVSDSSETEGLLGDVVANIESSQQWYLLSSAIQPAWRYLKLNGVSAGGSSSVTVAVIDTGVDYTHPDLYANMWINRGEIPGNGIDDDGNGYIDDVYGVNTVADNGGADGAEGDPMDDHGHGTHVAGIIGASNNLIGTVGVAYNTKIMAVKAGQATGVFNQSDIAEAILYAYEMGADVINMSFGGSACSIAVQDALSTAYTRATLVASAGNDGMPNEETDHYKEYGEYLPNYPAALSYVIGVMSVDRSGRESAFTNWDASAFNALEYEVYAPGEDILSTLPGGRWGRLSGTSMAAPIVSGAAALLRSYYTDRDMYPSKFISAQLCATSQDAAICLDPEDHAVNGGPHNLPMRLNVYDAMTKLPQPDVTLYEHYLFDDESIAEGNNGDGVVDAGETIEIGAILRNRWGMSENTVVSIDATGDLGIDHPYVEILNGSVHFEGVGTYSTKDMLIRNEQGVVTGTENPLVVKIADNCPNDYRIVLNVTVTCKNGLDEGDKNTYTTTASIGFWVRNGVVLTGQITEDQTWTKDNYYIIPSSLYIAEGVTVTVEPGTQIQFWSDDPKDPYADTYIAQLRVAGKFLVEGSEEDPVQILPSELMGNFRVEIVSENTGWVNLSYANIANPYLHVDRIDHCYITQNYDTMYYRFISNGKVGASTSDAEIQYAQVTNTQFYNVTGASVCYLYNSTFENCSFVDSVLALSVYDESIFTNCVFQGCGKQYNKTSSFTFRQRDKFDVVYFKINPNTGTAYASVCSSNTIAPARIVAKALGGDLACLETEEEYNWLKNSAVWYGCVGLKYGEDTWVNGAPAGDFLNISSLKVSSKNAYLYRWGEDFDFQSPGYWMIEIPAPYAPETAEELQAKIDEIFENGLPAYRFVGNAVLNNFNDPDITNWLRIQGDTRSQGPNYEQIINLSGNWWGTTEEELVEKQILDFDDYNTLADIYAGDFLTTPPEDTFPFVTDAYLLDQNGERVRTVGNETVTFVVEFNRDMDTSMPLRVRFGSSEPYGEYEVEGSFVSARRWEGTYTLKTTIENGNQVINIENGRAADDHWLILCESAGRFQFEIDTTAAQAMLMQASATETGIQLTWMQDDFTTLAGYNVYRSNAEDGLYERLNDYVLPVGEEQFFDDTAEPGMLYWYTFTVVQTDLSESSPSGKVSVRAFDTMAPDIYHSPVRTAFTGSNLVVSATITDNLQITSATLYYRTAGGEWKSTQMSALNSRYSGIIPAEELSLDGLEYYIDAFDGISHTCEGTAEDPFEVIVKLAVDRNSMGDVDGDGSVTAKDALMLLQAANDIILLDAEQFERADLDGDGILTASEALTILQYVSGKITSLFPEA